MPLTERIVIDRVEVVENNIIQVRQATVIERDGVEIARTFHRWTLCPGDDLSNQDAKIVAIANAVWTDDVIGEYASKRSASQLI